MKKLDGVWQFDEEDLADAGVKVNGEDGVYKLTVDDINLWLRVHADDETRKAFLKTKEIKE